MKSINSSLADHEVTRLDLRRYPVRSKELQGRALMSQPEVIAVAHAYTYKSCPKSVNANASVISIDPAIADRR